MSVEHAKTVGDIAAGGVTVATIAGWLPAVAALFTVIYTGMRAYEWIVKKQWRKNP